MHRASNDPQAQVVDLSLVAEPLRYFRGVARWYVAVNIVLPLALIVSLPALVIVTHGAFVVKLNPTFVATVVLSPWLIGFALRGSFGFFAAFGLLTTFYLIIGGFFQIFSPTYFLLFPAAVLMLFSANKAYRLDKDLPRTRRDVLTTYRENLKPSIGLHSFFLALRMSRLSVRAALYALVSVLLMLLTLTYLGLVLQLYYYHAFHFSRATEMYPWLINSFGLVSVAATLVLVPPLTRRARVAFQLGASDAQLRDQRPPTLFLRSFQDDETRLAPTSWFRYVTGGFRNALTLEEVLVDMLRHSGPVIAIGRPGELAAPLGAARAYYAHDAWQDAVLSMLQNAQRVVLVLGPTENIAWEFAKARDLGILEKLIVVLPPAPKGHQDRWSRLAEVFPQFRDVRGFRDPPLTCTLSADHLVLFACDKANEDAYRIAMIAAELELGRRSTEERRFVLSERSQTILDRAQAAGHHFAWVGNSLAVQETPGGTNYLRSNRDLEEYAKMRGLIDSSAEL